MTKRFSIVGAGRLGASLGAALVRRGWTAALVIDKDPRAAREARRIMGAGRAATALRPPADPGGVVIVAVPDDAVVGAAAALARSGAAWPGRTVLHTSGIHPARVLEPLRDRGARAASLHPAQAFPRKDTPASVFKGVTWAAEGDPEAVRTAARIVADLRGRLLLLSEADKPLYHAACVLASNALAALEWTAAGLLGRAGLGLDEAAAVLLPLAQGTLQNVKNLGPEKALTGPILRGDEATVRKHLEALRADPGALEIYRVMGKAISRVAARRGVPHDRIRTLRRLLEGK